VKGSHGDGDAREWLGLFGRFGTRDDDGGLISPYRTTFGLPAVLAVVPGGVGIRRVLDDRSAKALARGARTGVRMIWIRSEPKTSSKLAVNLASRSRTRNLIGRARSVSSMLRLRACWVTHDPTGLVETPAT